MNVVKLVKRWLGEELTSSTAPKMKDAAALAAAAKAGDEGEGEEPVMYKKVRVWVSVGGGRVSVRPLLLSHACHFNTF